MTPHPLPTAASAAAPESHATSDAKRLANAANAQLSTGPASAEGKAKSSLNALKTGLTGRTVLLPAEDAAAYQQHVSGYEKELRPVGQRECDLVQSIADGSWRLQRIPVLESAIYAQGRLQFAEQFNDQDPAYRATLIDLHTHLAYEKQIRNLHTQESRLHRRREKDLAELRQAQSDRRNRDTNNLESASRLLIETKRANKSFNPQSHGPAFLTQLQTQFGGGFEFSLADIEAYSSGCAVLDIAYAAFKRDSASRNQMQTAA
jgi:predicted secreted protein